jgi:hypothetical protein
LKATGRAVSEGLKASLEPFATGRTNDEWREHLFDLCESAVEIRLKMRRHPSRWTFGSWDDYNLKFPSVSNNGAPIIPAQLE